MTRILSYNILTGGVGRIDTIERMIRTANPDIVGLVEATNQDVVKELAKRLGMDYRVNETAEHTQRPSLALLSRLPIVSTAVHTHPILRAPLLEVGLQEQEGEKAGEKLTVFVTHLSASFARFRGGDRIRLQEVQQILHFMQANHDPHVLMGDFNSLAPGDSLKTSNLLRYLIIVDHFRARYWPQGSPTLNFVVPPRLHFLMPILRLIPKYKGASWIFDDGMSLYVARATIGLLRTSGYVDCFRYINPRSWGFTCPSAFPAGRIDYLFANPRLATRLSACKVIDGNGEIKVYEASDHLPVMAEFGLEVAEPARSHLEQPVGASGTSGEAF